jgi:molybdate transport system substrate-binding protein
MGTTDASIIWQASLIGTENETDIIEIPKEQNLIEVIPIGTLTFSENEDTAKQFVDFVSSDEGKAIFEKHGFTAYPNPKYESSGETKAEELMVYSGAGLAETMNILGTKFEKEHGTKVKYNYAGSGHLLSQMEITQQGDVFIPGALFTFNKAKEKGFIEPDSEKLVAYHIPVIGVKKGNPANITSLDDLTKPGIKVALGDPKVVPIGRGAEKILKDAGIEDKVNIVSRAAEEPQLVVWVSEGVVDAAIFWRSSLWELRDRIDIIEIPKEQNCIETIPIGVLTFSENKDTAQEFCDYVVSEEGKRIWAENGYVIYPNQEYE